MKSYQDTLKLDTPAQYRIRIAGSVNSSWADELGSMDISRESAANGSPVTVLTGRLVDQAALFGIINHLYGLGFPLLSVEWLECKSAETT